MVSVTIFVEKCISIYHGITVIVIVIKKIFYFIFSSPISALNILGASTYFSYVLVSGVNSPLDVDVGRLIDAELWVCVGRGFRLESIKHFNMNKKLSHL